MNALTPTTQAIARGRHAELYAIEPDRVLKLFRPGFSRPATRPPRMRREFPPRAPSEL